MRVLAIFLLVMSVSASAVSAEEGSAGAGHKRTNHVLDPVHNEKFEYYDVCGCSEKDLQCDLTLKAIKCSDGKKYDSVTNWKVKWDYGHNRDSKTCTTKSFTVTVDITFRLPKWVRETDAPQKLSDKWDSYIKNLIVHETGHRDRALAAAKEITRNIAELPPAGSCSELDREVNGISRERLNKLIAEQAEYDEVTNHGHSQGVLFP